MTLAMSTLRPGLLVGLKTSVTGNVSYQREDIERRKRTSSGAIQSKWQTQRTVLDEEEYEAAHAVRSTCRGLIYRCCAASTFGLLCPEEKRDELDEAVQKSQELCRDFNLKAKITNVRVYVIVGRIAADDVEAVRAINSEVRGLLSDMEEGIKKLDAKAVRQAATKAKSIGRMLSPEAEQRVKVAIEAAREVAKRIVKAGEETSAVIDQAIVRRITDSRTSFLDLDEQGEVQAPAAKSRAVDLEPVSLQVEKSSAAVPQLELE